MKRIRGFEPIAARGAHTLILGSMPSLKSLREGRYYAHPRNAFWPIVRELLALPELDYAALTRAVAGKGFAIWDVVASCHRPGSLDAAIDLSSIVPNDIGRLLSARPAIDRIFFNGSTAERLFRRLVLPGLGSVGRECALQRLPSTSPAHAAMSWQGKLAAWRAILPVTPAAERLATHRH